MSESVECLACRELTHWADKLCNKCFRDFRAFGYQKKHVIMTMWNEQRSHGVIDFSIPETRVLFDQWLEQRPV